MIEELVKFIHIRNSLGQWSHRQSWGDWLTHIDEELEEARQEICVDKLPINPNHVAEELGDVLVLVLSLIARYSTLSAVFEAAYKKLQKRAPYVAKGVPVSYEQEMKYWNKGR